MFGIGRLMGLAITTQTPLSLKMSRTLYKVILGEAITSYDVERTDPTFYKSRVAIVMEKNGVEKMEAIMYDELYFVGMPTTEEEAEEGTGEPLIKNGATTRVTESNKKRYVQLLIEHYLIGRAREGVSLIVEGFKDIVPKSILRQGEASTKVSALDLELIVSGLPDIDVEDWKKHTNGNINSIENKELKDWFWELVTDMDVEQRAKLLSYSCGSSRLPARGFCDLLPHPFNVSVTGESVNNLPSAHTCFNQLQMPRYVNKQQLATKLKMAVEQCEGFAFM